jgi:hypothetical protein
VTIVRLTASGDNVLIANSGGSIKGSNVNVKGMFLYNVTAGTTVKLTQGAGGAELFRLTTLPANFAQMFPVLTDTSNYFQSNSTSDLVANLSASTEVEIILFWTVT